MNHNAVTTEVKVDGQSCDFSDMKLTQSISGHHVFEVSVNYRHKKKNVWMISVDDIFRETLNKPVFIKMKHRDSGETNEFEGIVTDIEAVGVDGDQGTVILRGGSPTLLLDRDPSLDSFMDYNLYNIVAETIEHTGVKVEVQNKPQLTQPIPYIARHCETSYAFLSRILAAYGEWFYYDGKKLIVGRPLDQKAQKFTFDVELAEVKSIARMRNLNTVYYDYDPYANNHFEEEAGTISNANLPMKAAKIASGALYPVQTILPTGRAILDERDMTAAVRVLQSREYVKASLFKAKCNSCAVRIGEAATIRLPEMKDVFWKDLGEFLVTEIEHHASDRDHYINTFTGIAGVTETLPDDHIVMPQAFPEPATVVDNNDPKKQGRIKVRFFWQPKTESTNWIRVQQPDAGKSGNVPTNRGFWFIPEIDDQVMVGFQQGDPSRPYVMGSLFHRDNTRGAAKENTIKSIVTRSGHTIEFNDDEKDGWGITIRDKQGNIIHLDTLNKNIKITAPETMTLNAKNINIFAKENMNLTSGKNMTQSVGENFYHSVEGDSVHSVNKNLDLAIDKDYSITVGKAFTHNIVGKMEQTAQKIDIIAEKGTARLSAQDELTIKSSTEVIIAK